MACSRTAPGSIGLALPEVAASVAAGHSIRARADSRLPASSACRPMDRQPARWRNPGARPKPPRDDEAERQKTFASMLLVNVVYSRLEHLVQGDATQELALA